MMDGFVCDDDYWSIQLPICGYRRVQPVVQTRNKSFNLLLLCVLVKTIEKSLLFVEIMHITIFMTEF